MRRSAGSRQLAFAFDASLVPRASGTAGELAPARQPVPSALGAPSIELAAAAPARPGADEARRSIAEAVGRALGVRVEVELTRNRRTMISCRRAGDALRVRLHQMFLEADGAIVEALGRYVRNGDRRASRRLGEFIESRRDREVARRPLPPLCPTGRHFDLRVVFTELERTHFPGALEGVSITWGRRSKPGRKRSIRLGTYTHDDRLIRVHPALDQTWVPRFFVDYIVFHEMLHHVEPAREQGGRILFHTDAFRARERAFPGYVRALAWEREHIGRLLGSA